MIVYQDFSRRGGHNVTSGGRDALGCKQVRQREGSSWQTAYESSSSTGAEVID